LTLFFYLQQSGWNSAGSYDFSVLRFSSGTDILDNSVQFTGRPSRFLIGYTLLSR